MLSRHDRLRLQNTTVSSEFRLIFDRTDDSFSFALKAVLDFCPSPCTPSDASYITSKILIPFAINTGVVVPSL